MTAAGASALGEKVVIKAGALITMAGPTVEDGVIVMEGGRITAVGPAAEVEVPWDAEVIEARRRDEHVQASGDQPLRLQPLRLPILYGFAL